VAVRLNDEEPVFGESGSFNPKGFKGYSSSSRYRKTKPNKGIGLSDIGAQLANFMNDSARNVGNFASTAGSFLSSNRQPAAGGGFGDYLVGRGADSPVSPMRRRGETVQRLQQQEEQAEEGTQLGILDFLAQAQGLMGGAGGGGVNYDPLRQAARGRFTEGDAKLEAMYRQLADSIGAQAGTIASNYDAGAAGLNQNAAQAQSTIGDAYEAARAAQTRQLQQLGIGDAAGVIASEGTDAGAEQARALANVEQNRAANVGANEAAKQSGLAQNASHVSAAGLAGAEQRGRLQAELNQLLGEYDVAEQTQNAQLASRAQDPTQALSIAQMLQEDYNSRQPQAPTFDQQLDLERLAIERLKAMGSGRTLQDALGEVTQLQQVAKQQGIPEDRFSDWAKLVLGAV
jgi:hypothetical protein